jgi:hypothetical protein
MDVTVIAVGLFILAVFLGMLRLGVAFVSVPFLGFFYSDLVHEVRPLGLLLNGVTAIFAAYGFARSKLIDWKTALPVLSVATLTAAPWRDVGPAGAPSCHLADQLCCGVVSGLPPIQAGQTGLRTSETPNFLLTGRMHGDEPTGVVTALQWMESDDWRRWQVNWLELPCVNPPGWTRNRRTNADGQDINRHFLDSDQCQEADIVRRVLGRKRFLFAVDLHEDSDADGYYFCETKAGPPFLGERIPQALPGLLLVAGNHTLDGRRAQGPAWVLRLARRNAFERRRTWPLAFHLGTCRTDHFLCSETPTKFPLSLPIRANLAALSKALRFVNGKSSSKKHSGESENIITIDE